MNHVRLSRLIVFSIVAVVFASSSNGDEVGSLEQLDKKRGFRDLEFGTAPTKNMVPNYDDGKPLPPMAFTGLEFKLMPDLVVRVFERQTDRLEIGKAPLAFIHYVFHKDAFVQVQFGTHSGKSFDACDKLGESLQSVWGRPTDSWTDQFQGMNAVWKGEVVAAALRIAQYGSDCQVRLSDRAFFRQVLSATEKAVEREHKSTQEKTAGDL